MASITKRRNKNGTSHWRAVVRIKGYPTVCNHFDRKQEAEDWAVDTEREIRLGRYKPERVKATYTFDDLVERYLESGALEHHKSAKDTIRHLEYWKERFRGYALIHLNSEFLGKERKLLQETSIKEGKIRSPATVNRYFASLSSILSYAARELGWLLENPCLNTTKLKENKGRDRVFSNDEIVRLLSACRQSKSPYLYCIVLMSLTTGARQGELVGLEWRHIDMENKIAFIQETKNGRPRGISLADPVIDELKRLHEKRNPAKPLVFASKTAFGRIDIKKAWKQALKIAQIDNCRPHDMRHTFCTLAASQGASNLELATAMGHRTLSMLQRYTHLDVKVTKKFSKNISEQILMESLNDH